MIYIYFILITLFSGQSFAGNDSGTGGIIMNAVRLDVSSDQFYKNDFKVGGLQIDEIVISSPIESDEVLDFKSLYGGSVRFVKELNNNSIVFDKYSRGKSMLRYNVPVDVLELEMPNAIRALEESSFQDGAWVKINSVY